MSTRNPANLLLPTVRYWRDTPDWSGEDFQQNVQDRITELLQIKLGNGRAAIDIRRPDVAAEVVGLLIHYPFEEVVAFLRGAPDENYIIYEQPAFDEARQRITEEIETTTSNPPGTTAFGKCRYCDCKELAFQTVQTRSGDEAMTTFVACVQCGRSWRY